MTASDERLLGFDARSLAEEPEAWPPERRATFLLRPSVAQPLSTDPLVWPRVVEESALLAPSLRGLQRRLTGIDGPYAVIAVSLLSVPPGPDSLRALPTPEPAAIDGGWRRLGYDVSDAALLSGLSNCGYDAGGVDALRARWAPELNDHHLFGDPARALEFRELTDERVPEHAPFFVYGLSEVLRA